MSRTPSIGALQRWMLSVISHPGGVIAGVDSQPAQNEFAASADTLDMLIQTSEHFGSVQRLGVYANAYYARLLECLSGEFPAVSHALGEETFQAFAFEYLQRHPPQSYTLNQLGAAFPAFLKSSRPVQDRDSVTPDWSEFLIELAQLERCYSDVFDGPGEENLPKLSIEQFQGIPSEVWDSLILQTAPSLKLVGLSFPVQEYITSLRRGLEPEFPIAVPTWLVVNRRDYVVRRQAVSLTEWTILKRLQEQHPLGEVMASATSVEGLSFEQLASLIPVWFQRWATAGYFLGVRGNS
ncbi:putative DNA-binding domain-containing protein [Planctomicrobium sp. SH668]|uniref:HvfC/BufC family peptide modification chaperone n=1 Tax=Planctomicrobium sp. SH668 TaxID=3448126 RepID=UPI003F5CBB46